MSYRNIILNCFTSLKYTDYWIRNATQALWLYLHEPMEVMVDAAGVCLIYLYNWQEILISYKDLVFMV
jgi:hypothetical protein